MALGQFLPLAKNGIDYVFNTSAGIEIPDGYQRLGKVLSDAMAQAARGKGKERHAGVNENFEDQQIVEIARRLGSEDGPLFQAVKKIYESKRLSREAAKAELLGAINYLAAAIIVREEAARGNDEQG
jgi:hypothetical protein